MKKLLGTMRLPETMDQTVEWLREAHKLGINWIDTAKVYGGGEVEVVLGEALEILREEGITFKIQTKIWTDDYKIIKKAFKKQLANLRMDKVDALLLHRPSRNLDVDIKAWRHLIEFKEQGLTDIIGVSNYDKDMIIAFEMETGVCPSINQIELSVSNFRDDRVYFANFKKIEIQSWTSFGNNVKRNIESEIVQSLSKKYNAAPGTILASFLSTQGIIVMNASFNPEHLKETINTIELTEEEIFELKKLNRYDNKFGETYP